MSSMTIDELEAVLPYMHRSTFSELLDRYGRTDRKMRGTFFEAARALLKGKRPQNTVIADRFQSLTDEIKNQLLPVLKLEEIGEINR